MNDAEKRIVADIEKYGWHVTGVFDPKGINPPFAYSTGIFNTTGKPELIVVGVHLSTAAKIINKYGDRIKDDLASYDANCFYGDLLEGFKVLMIEAGAQAKTEYTLSCKWLYKGVDFPLLQCVWESEDHLWPWEAGASEGLRRDQPILSELPNGL